ncbi:Uncharacterised protein [Mycobacteroides abscessus subsp. abscessus]|nr:Uncharacterised protein [Mycobacteroides abscessus subsp. abscessus]
MAHRGQQCATHLVGLGECTCLGRLAFESTTLHRAGGLDRHRGEYPSIPTAEFRPAQQQFVFTAGDRADRVGVFGALRRVVADSGVDDASTIFFVHHRYRGLVVGLTHALQQCRDVSSTEHGVGEQRQQLGVTACQAGLPTPVRSRIDQCGNRYRDHQHDKDGDEIVRLVDGEREPWVGEEVVEQQAGHHRRQCRRPDAAQQRDREHRHEEQRRLAGEPQPTVQDGEYDRHDHRYHDRRDPAQRTMEARVANVESISTTRLVVGDHVDVDLPAVRNDIRTDALVEESLPARTARRTQHQLGRVDATCEVEERRRNVVAHNGVDSRAESLGQLVQPGQLGSGCPD